MPENQSEQHVRFRPAAACLAAMLAAAMLLGGCYVAPPTTDFPHVKQTDPISGAEYWIFVPETYREWTPAPLIVTCHGTVPFDTSDMHIREWKDLAEANGCIVLAPDLTGTDGIIGDGPVYAMEESERRIMSVVSTVCYDYNVDRANVMITGFSGGGFPTYFVGLRHPEVFTAIAARNCNFSQRNLDGWYRDNARRIPVLVYWGSADPLPIVIQSHNAVDYLQSKGFSVTQRTLPGVGHERHPEVAMSFFLNHRKPPVGSLKVNGYRVTRPAVGPVPVDIPGPTERYQTALP